MKEVRVSDGIVPLGEFKARAARYLEELQGSERPIVITQNGRPAGVLLSPEAFDRLRERERFLDSVTAGLADAENGRSIDHEELRERVRAWRRDRDDE